MSNRGSGLRIRLRWSSTCALLVAAAALAMSAWAASPARPDPSGASPRLNGGGVVVSSKTPGRDPFKLPPPPVKPSGKFADTPPLDLPPGVRGLIISSLELKGVVSENAGRQMIAVVTNETHRAYFLRVHERLYDGVVTQITPQAVFFTEMVRNRRGWEDAHEVVKRLNPKAGDRQ